MPLYLLVPELRPARVSSVLDDALLGLGARRIQGNALLLDSDLADAPAVCALIKGTGAAGTEDTVLVARLTGGIGPGLCFVNQRVVTAGILDDPRKKVRGR